MSISDLQNLIYLINYSKLRWQVMKCHFIVNSPENVLVTLKAEFREDRAVFDTWNRKTHLSKYSPEETALAIDVSSTETLLSWWGSGLWTKILANVFYHMPTTPHSPTTLISSTYSQDVTERGAVISSGTINSVHVKKRGHWCLRSHECWTKNSHITHSTLTFNPEPLIKKTKPNNQKNPSPKRPYQDQSSRNIVYYEFLLSLRW